VSELPRELAAPVEPAGIRSSDHVVFYPTYGYLNGGGSAWVIPIQGWVFDGRTRRKPTVAMALLRRYLGRHQRPEERERFRSRSLPFRLRGSRGRKVAVHAAGELHELAHSAGGGRFAGTIHVPATELAEPPDLAGGRWIEFRAALSGDDSRSFPGKAQLLGREGLSVVSDIDDTIKITAVRQRREMLRNTFLRDFAAVPGMSELYAAWAGAGAAFHYVSASPWQLFDPLSEFLATGGFPQGSFHLKLVRGKMTAFWKLFASARSKLAAIEAILTAFPRRRFVFVGDTAAKDPELYGRLARERPNQAAAILIREVEPGGCPAARLAEAFAGLPRELWQVFRDPCEVRVAAGVR
jgi:hypothetical protein